MAKTEKPSDKSPEKDKPATSTPVPDDTLERVSFYVDKATGALGPTTRDETKQKLARMVARPETRKLLGVDGPGPTARTGTDASVVAMLYAVVGRLEIVVAKMAGVPADRAEALAFTPDEVALLVPPTKAVLDKYDVSFGSYEEEFALGAALLPIVLAKVALLRGGPVQLPLKVVS